MAGGIRQCCRDAFEAKSPRANPRAQVGRAAPLGLMRPSRQLMSGIRTVARYSFDHCFSEYMNSEVIQESRLAYQWIVIERRAATSFIVSLMD